MLDAAKQERGLVPAETTRITDNPAMRATPAERFFGIAEMRQQLYKHLDKPSLAMSAVLCQCVLEEVVSRLYAEIKYEHKDTFVHSPDRSQLYRNAVRTLILNWADKTTATEVRDATAALDLTALGQPTGLDASSKRQLAIIPLARDLFPAVINILQPASDHEQSIRLDPTTELRGHITEVAEYYYADNGDDEEELASCGTLLSGFTRAASAIDMHLSNPSPACFDMLKARPPGARVRDIHIAGSRTTPRYMRSLFTLLRSLGDDLGYIRVISVDNSTEHDIMHLAEWSFPNLRDLILGRYGNNDGAPASLCLAQLPDILQVLSTSPELEHLALYLTASPGFGECAREWSPPTSRPMRLESVWLFFDERSRVNKGRWYNVLYHLAGWVVENGDIRFIMHGQHLSRRYPLMHVYEDAAEAFKRLHRRLDKPFSICDRDMYDLGVTSSDDIDQLLIDPNGEPYTVLQSLIRHVSRHGDLDRIEEGRRVGELMQVIQNKEAQPEQAEDSYNQLRELTFRWGFPERPDTADATPMPRKVTYLLGSEYRAVRGMQKLMDYLGRIEWGRKAE